MDSAPIPERPAQAPQQQQQQPPQQEQASSDAAQNLLHADPVTGEQISKSELKRRQKQRKAAATREAAQAAREQAQQAQGNAPSSSQREGGLNPNQYFELRSRQIQALRKSQSPNPYPHKFHENTRLKAFLDDEQNKQIKSGDARRDVEVRIGLRIMAQRSYGSSLLFYDCKADGLSVQVMCEPKEATATPFAQQHDHIRSGDLIGVIGFPGRTSPKSRDVGELSIFAREVILQSPSLHPIPKIHFGLRDKELRFRRRYLDLIVNHRARDTLIKRAKIIRYLRGFLEKHDFLEVETPIINSKVGGATAKPFKTYHNDLGESMVMRIAPELYLKQLVVGGLHRVFEIGRQFRNEDLDLTHNPEFTTVEFYSAFFDYLDVLEFTEEMISSLVKEVCGSYETKYHTQDGKEFTVNWERPWRRVQMIPALEEATGVKFPPADQLNTDESLEFLKGLLEKKKVRCSPPLTASRIIDKLVGEYIESTCISPTFIMGHPRIMSPLAKVDRNIPGLCERFEAFVCTKEICNAYTELNDPFDQRERFLEQAKDKARGDDEAQLIDEQFCTALEYGLPPTGGWGLGVDRLVMFLTDHYNIKEVLAFPMMKDEAGARAENEAATTSTH